MNLVFFLLLVFLDIVPSSSFVLHNDDFFKSNAVIRGRPVPFQTALPAVSSDYEQKAKIQFIKGLDETVLPDVRLTRSRDGSTGTATFRFKNPNILDKKMVKEGEITGMYLIDEEGVLETRDINARFMNGKPEAIDSIYIMKSSEAWDRFIRFMERYGRTHGLIFTQAN